MMQQTVFIENGRSSRPGALRRPSPLRLRLRTSAAGGDNAEPRHAWARQVAAPAALLGGTAALYRHALRQPSAALTPLSVLYMLLLAVHYAVQPRLSKKYIAPETSSTSVALVEEVTKASLAAALYAASGRLRMSDIAAGGASAAWATLSQSLLVAGVPAMLYALQNVLQYTSHRHLDAITFNGLSQTKTLSAALWCWVLLQKPQTPLQVVALGLLFGSALLFQRDTTTAPSAPRATGTSKPIAPAAGPTEVARRLSLQRFWWGIVPCALATLLSGLAGALSQKGLQQQTRDAYGYAMEVSLYSALTLVAGRTVFGGSGAKAVPPSKREPFWRGWTHQTWYPVVCKAVGGVLTVLVHKYTGAVSKGFALMFGLVLAGVIESLVGSRPMPWPQLAGTVLVMLSGWMHLTQTT